MKRHADNLRLLEPQTLRLKKRDYYTMAEAGIFDGRRVELLDGEVIVMPPMGDRHALAIVNGTYILPPLFGSTHTVRVQLPLDFGDSQPEPDFAIVAGNYRTIAKHPTTALLVIEVAEKTLVLDQTRKARLYASRGIADYWIVNLNDNLLEVRRKPTRDADSKSLWRYDDVQTVSSGQSIAPLAFPRKKIKVADLLP